MTTAARDYRIKQLESHIKRTESEAVKEWANSEIDRLRAVDCSLDQVGVDIDRIYYRTNSYVR